MSKHQDSVMSSYERLSVWLLVPACILYSLAFVSHAWFELPGVFYGLWWAEFCDYLSCQIIPAFFTEEPVWYHILQLVSLFGMVAMSVSLALLVSKRCDFFIPDKMRRQQTASAIGLSSVFAISLALMMFYGKLDESSPRASPQIHWSAVMAGTACLLEFGAALLLLQS
ncbi:uncharacterized protein LOC132562154 [Ylistrum balloti]|uniref:uncharacterized protein LOC132562154 n=1 Tax=Ylistrum balloti TaxID=509963 RepID=UPI002905BB45|nr:uncharacterized protein LOC132562154 [Ylistrum balloti]